MARLADRVPENVAGDFYVDASCIDCDTCRMLAPSIFGDAPGTARVERQPAGAAETLRAMMALVSCPTSAIGAVSKPDPRPAMAALPDPVGDGVWMVGYSSDESYGATAWLVGRDGGNVLIDSPRAAKPLLARLDALGGVASMFLTHRDDVADHAVFAARFGCARIMHEADARGMPVERPVVGVEPVPLGAGMLAIPVPGHTRGSMALLVDDDLLFTGDHLWWDGDRLAMGRDVCWYSWKEQVRSLERLLQHRFSWVLPGHGRAWRAPSAAAMRREVERLWRAVREIR
jgi:glyoxylase-like metal-dependent hydrolase (beta-lactamase superfamily II)